MVREIGQKHHVHSLLAQQDIAHLQEVEAIHCSLANTILSEDTSCRDNSSDARPSRSDVKAGIFLLILVTSLVSANTNTTLSVRTPFGRARVLLLRDMPKQP